MNPSIEQYSNVPGLLELGWDEDLMRAMAAVAPGLTPGRVVAQHRGRYRVADPSLEMSAVLAGRLRHQLTDGPGLPAVGDWVAFAAAASGGSAAVVELLPRRSLLQRRRAGAATGAQVIAANVDIVLIAVALTEPLNARRLERYATLAWEGGAVPIVVLTKSDLCAAVEPVVAAATAVAPGTDVVAVSAGTGAGVERLRAHLRPRRTAVVLGQSGVGKSTLTNVLLGEPRLRTLAVRGDGKGRHTTTHRELFRLPGGALLIDTPGLREVGPWHADDGVRAAFEDLDALARGCRFADCHHAAEPGCAVQAAVLDGSLDAGRLAAWQRLQREMEHYARRDDPAAAAAARARVRALHRAVRVDGRRKRER